MRTRVIPVLLLRNQGLVKTVKFKKPQYVGDPINTIRIFNEKEVDEIAFLDILATPENKEPDYQMIEDIAGEAFMPVAYGGGIKTLEQAKQIFSLGIEKIILNSAVYQDLNLVRDIANQYGSQAVVICIDCQKNWFGNIFLYASSGSQKQKISLETHIETLSALNIGEIIVNDMSRDGTQSGYDLDLLNFVSSRTNIPVVALGGAGGIQDFSNAVNQGGVSAVGAGSLFVFNGIHKAVLISYPERQELESILP